MTTRQIRFWQQFHRVGIIAALAAALSFVGSAANAQNAEHRTRQPQAASAAAPAGNAKNGRQFYTKYLCYSCHGTDGQGGAGARLMGSNLPPFDAFRAYVRKPAGNMPPYRTTAIPDSELIDIYAYLKSIPAPTQAKSIPLLNQ
jgi:mono/diheme cytochrome c family protein